ncbi:hypothetical protein Halru_0687 [Halovivax ruber XH-70]|uniref:DUF7511 domain-containing protein n=1 Tax=Halovivax ruber (strain DSM 18193 / JCM 13892 / XH-70) TaxID=797302 RepID=L0I9E6_HALRX|nr:hypothetical protein Halru_0687 [Halovivax ruber XH-70]
MTADSHTRGNPTDQIVDDGPAHAPVDLVSTVVRNDAAPDRRTVYPRQCYEWARLTAWLSADDEVFLALDECR